MHTHTCILSQTKVIIRNQVCLTLKNCLPEKSAKNASKLQKQCSTLVKQSGKSNILIYSMLLNVRPGSAR